MTHSLIAAMTKARALVSSHRLGEATRLLQAALASGTASVPSPSAATPFAGPTLEHDAAEGGSGPREHGAEASSAAEPSLAGRFARQAAAFASRAGKPGGAPFAFPSGLSPLPTDVADRPDAASSTKEPGFRALRHTGPHGTMAYKLYVPAGASATPRPLVVMLHGCTQDADDFAAGTQMNAAAEASGALVLYPEQTKGANPSKCWNWFSPAHQQRGAGEPAVIAAIVAEITAVYDVDETKVFAAGLSAGGAMAAVLGATYPDIFAAVGVHSGLPYGSASDVMSALTAMRSGAANPSRRQHGQVRPARTIVFHGTEDKTVHPSNGRILAEGLSAGSTRPTLKTGTANGRRYTRTLLRGEDGAIAVEHWEIEGLSHAWSGGSSEGTYADAQGPDATREMMRFFLDTRP